MRRLFSYFVRQPGAIFYVLFMLMLLGWLAATSISDGIDWLDRRSCRMGGGRVIDLEHHEWHCAKQEAR